MWSCVAYADLCWPSKLAVPVAMATETNQNRKEVWTFYGRKADLGLPSESFKVSEPERCGLDVERRCISGPQLLGCS